MSTWHRTRRTRTARLRRRSSVVLRSAAGAFMVLASLGHADALVCTKTFLGSNGPWNDAGNWNPAGVPGAGDTACVSSGQTAIVRGGVPAIAALDVDAGGTVVIEANGSQTHA